MGVPTSPWSSNVTSPKRGDHSSFNTLKTRSHSRPHSNACILYEAVGCLFLIHISIVN